MAALLLVSLLYAQSRIADPWMHQRVVENLRLFAEFDATLKQDILRSRYRLLRHYDPLNATLVKMRSVHKDLHEGVLHIYRNRALSVDTALATVTKSLADKEELVEQFKSHNAILWNSTRYLPLAGENLILDAKQHKRQDVAELASRILRVVLFYNVMPSQELIVQAQSLNEALNKFAESGGPLSAGIGHIATHMAIVLQQRPVVDDLVNQIIATTLTDDNEALLRAHNLQYQDRVARARFFQMLLFAMVVLLVAYGTFLTVKQRNTAARLRNTVNALEYQQFALNQHSIVAIINPFKTIVSVNDKLCAISGYTSAEFVGKEASVLGVNLEDAQHNISNGEVWHGELHNLNKSGDVYCLDGTVVPFKDEKGKLYQYVLIATDVTLRKRAVEQLRHSQDQLEKLVQQRTAELTATNKELEAFAHSVSHDLRAPLRAIDGFSLALMEDYGTRIDPQGLDYLQRVRTATLHMGQLIDDLLALSRVTRQDLNARAVDLSHIAQQIAIDLQEKEPQRQIEFVIAPGIQAFGDERLLTIVMGHLLSNAFKYTSKHPLAKIEFGSVVENDETVYFVRDDGAGFDMQYVGKLFVAFQRLHKSDQFPGTGVGLTTTARIIHRHKGRIWAEGKVENGATFFFTLNLQAES